MSPRPEADEPACSGRSAGVGEFLRSLLSGIPWADRAQGEETLHLDAPPGGAIKIRNANGRTRVVGEDRQDIEVVALKQVRAESVEAAQRLLDQMRIHSWLVDDRMEIDVEIPKKWNRHGSANLEVHVPRELEVAVVAANGKLCVQGLRGAVRVRSSNGPIYVSDVVGDVGVITSNAKVSCECTCGRLTARSSNGKIQLDDHRGSIDATTSNGTIHVTLDAIGEEGVMLATSNGRIVLELPSEVDADLDMRVDNGLIRNDRELDRQTRESNGRVRGRLGRGGSLIKLRTSNGTISLR